MNHDFQPGQAYNDDRGNEINIIAVTEHEVTIQLESGQARAHHRIIFESMAKRFHFKLIEPVT